MAHHRTLPKKGLLASALLVALAAPAAAQTQTTTTGQPPSQDPTELDTVMVTGIRGSMMSSMNVKRDAQGVVDGIIAEDIGKFPDTNLAESLQRISGVSIDRSNGEGSKVTVRGIGPDFNLVLLNGRQMPTATGGRAFEFSDLASESISAVDVYKTSRASTPVGGIGATINIKTARPLDRPGMQASVGMKGVFDTSDDDLPKHYQGSDITPEMSGIFSNTFFDDRFGIQFSASRQERESGSASASVASGNGWQRYIDTPQANGEGAGSALPLPGAPGSENITNRPGPNDVYSMPQSLAYNINSVHRQRTNGQVVMQFAPTDNLTATLDYTYSENKIQARRNDMSVWFNFTPDESAWTPGSGSSPTYYHESYNPNAEGLYSDFANGAGNTAVRKKNESVGFNVEWQVNDQFSMNLDYHDSTAESLPDSPYGTSNTMSAAGFFRSGAAFDMSGDFPILTMELPNGMTAIDPAGMEASGSVFRNDYQRAEIQQGQVGGAFVFEDYSTLKFGVGQTDYRNRTAFTNVQLDTWGGNVHELGGPALYPDDAFPIAYMGDYFSEFGGANSPAFTDAFFLFDFERLRQLAAQNWVDAGKGIAADYLASTDYTGAAVPGSGANRTVGDSRVREKSRNAYVEWSNTFDFSMPLSVAIGMRYEDTEVTATALQPAAAGVNWQGVNEFNIVYLGSEYFTQTGDYKYWLPSLDLGLDLNDEMKLRFSASKTIGRPNWGDLNAAQTLGSPARFDGGGGNSGNPGLKPLVAKNFDVSYEWYYDEGSYFSVGYFYKKIDNFIASQTMREVPVADLYTPAGGAYWNAALSGGSCASTDRACIRDYIFANFDGQPGVNEAANSIVGQPGDPVLEFNISRPVNNRSDKLDGWEVNLQHVFGQSGFGFAANYTKVDSGLTYNNGVLGTQFAMTGLSDSANLVAFYDKDKWQIRAAYNWRDEFLHSLGDGKGNNPQYVEAYGQLDLNLSYLVTENFSLSLEAINLTNETMRVHGRNERQLYSLEQFGPRYMLGARYKF